MSRKVAVVTGAARGIGRACAIELARSGMHVVVNYRASTDLAEEVVREIGRYPAAVAVQADVSKEADVQGLVDQTLLHYGRIDVLVNNAGAVFRADDCGQTDLDRWDRMLAVNLTGTYLCIKAFAPHLGNGSEGKIVNITSVYGIIGAAAVAAYTAAKAGAINLTLSYAKELAPRVNVNAVAPGNISTDMTAAAGAEFSRWAVSQTPLARLGTPQDVAAVVAFLASPKANYITGQVLVVDGGFMLR